LGCCPERTMTSTHTLLFSPDQSSHNNHKLPLTPPFSPHTRYTSIGDVRTTVRNPALLRPEAAAALQQQMMQEQAQGRTATTNTTNTDNDGGDDNDPFAHLPTDPALFLPAYQLQDYTLERANRTAGGGASSKAKPPTTAPPPQPAPGAQPPTMPLPAAVGIVEESLDASGGSSRSEATEAAAALAAGRRKRGSFCERVPVALLCVGDFLSHRDSAPMALAHELRELRCRVAPVTIVPPHPALVRAQLGQLLRLAHEEVGDGSAPRVVFVLSIDGGWVDGRVDSLRWG
jgi:hypothetical protein